MSKKKTYKTIKDAAEALLLHVSYVDIYGRNVGLTYKAILGNLHVGFPKSSTSIRSLREIAYALNASKQMMPVRRRSPRILARDYARALLVHRDGYSYKSIASRVKHKFPEYNYLSKEQLLGLARCMRAFKMPERPPK